jgi:hypothetical protein
MSLRPGLFVLAVPGSLPGAYSEAPGPEPVVVPFLGVVLSTDDLLVVESELFIEPA